MRLLPNPERAWERATHVQTLARAEIERRVLPFSGEVEVLSGGHARRGMRWLEASTPAWLGSAYWRAPQLGESFS
ncbi:hypothetical protein [Sorangium atrum]|uniref:Uncharacterized protein n=1 Tax=Sorangium atrum TaxID=2995308 RepID=A0ABT5BRS3_9BACT|nr:hypothetical protein [Sorangium aterium]MDC0676871.1 hypothetical protein [Sorangium aterium]